MKFRLSKIISALVVVLVIAGGSYWQVVLNKDWREQYAYAKGVDAMIYSFPYFLNSAVLYKWGLAHTPNSKDAANRFWHSSGLVNPKTYRDGGMPSLDTFYAVSWIYAKQQPIIISIPAMADDRYYSFEFTGFDSDNFTL